MMIGEPKNAGVPVLSPVVLLRLTEPVPVWATVESQLNVPWDGC
jgi:hypothetical protein